MYENRQANRRIWLSNIYSKALLVKLEQLMNELPRVYLETRNSRTSTLIQAMASTYKCQNWKSVSTWQWYSLVNTSWLLTEDDVTCTRTSLKHHQFFYSKGYQFEKKRGVTWIGRLWQWKREVTDKTIASADENIFISTSKVCRLINSKRWWVKNLWSQLPPCGRPNVNRSLHSTHALSIVTVLGRI